MSLVFVTLGVAKIVDISIAADILQAENSIETKLYVGRHVSECIFNNISVYKRPLRPFI